MQPMNKLKKILLLTDFSDVANNAALYASNISKKTNSEVEILHIINTPVDWVKHPLEKEKLYPETKAEIGRAKSKLSAMVREFKLQGIEAADNLIYNVGAEDLPHYIKKEKYDLIIMGSHGSKGIKEYVIGSNAQKVIRACQVPVLVVKTPPARESIDRIVMASTFEENQKPFFNQLFDYASDWGADVSLLYINTPYHFKESEEIENMLATFCSDGQGIKCSKEHVDALNEERGIQFFMNKSNADLFAIATSGKSRLARMISPSLSEAVVNHLDIPVLVFHV